MTHVYTYDEEKNSHNISVTQVTWKTWQKVSADLLVETVGFQALEDHGIQHRVRMVSSPLPSNNAG